MANDGTLKFDTAIDASGFQDGISSIGSIAERGLKATMGILTGAATTIGTLGVAAIKVGSDFEGAMSKVEAISGATGSDLEALTNKAKEMGASTKFSATESANAFEYMAMAGWKTEDMLNGIEGIMNLAAASGEDLATTSDIVTDALTAFGLSAQDSTHFADILAQASSNANTNVGMMGETFKYVAPVAGALGYSAEDTATAIGLMANAGIKGSQAGTSLRSIMSRLAKPTDEVQAAMDALGISLTDDHGKMKGLNEIMADLRTGFSGLSEAEAAQMAAALGGQEAMSGLLAIVNASDADFNKLQSSIYSCDGAAAQMAETMNDNLQGQITILKSGLEGLGISFYENIQTPLKDIAIEAQGMVQQLQDAFNEGGLTGMVTAFGDVLAQIVERVAGAAPELINAATGLVSSFCDSLKSSTGIGEAAASLITSLVTALFSCADDIWTTAIVLAGKMAQGIADGAPEMVQSVATCVTDIFECLSDWAPDFVDAGVQIIGSVAQGLADTLPTILQHGIDIVLELGRGIAESLPTLIPIAVDCILNLFDTFVNNLDSIVDVGIEIIMAIAEGLIQALPILIQKAPDIIVNFWKALDKNLVKILKAGVDLILKLVEGIISAIPELIKNLPKILEAIVLTIQHFNFLQAGKSIITSIGEGIKSAGGSLIKAVTSINWASVASSIATMASNALNVVKTYLAEAIVSLVTASGEFFSELPGKVWDAIISAVTKIAEWGIQMREAVSNAASNCIDSVVTWFSGLPEKIGTWLTGVVNKIITWGSEMLTAAGQAASDVISGVADFFAGLPNKIAYWLGYAIGTVIKWGVELYTWVTTEIPNIIQSVVDFFAELPGKIWTWLVETVNKAVQWGINLKNTAETWVTNTINSVVNFFSTLPGKVWTWLVETVNRVFQWGINLKNTAETWVTNTINSVVNFFSQMPGRIWTWLVDTVNKVTQWGANLLSTASTAASNTVNKVVEWFSQLPGKIWTWLQNTITKVIQFGADMASKASSAAQGFVTNIVNGLSGLPGQMVTIGSNIVNGIWNGISSGWSWLVDKVKSLANSLFEGAKEALGINSPSRVFAREVGRWIPPGIGVGIDEAMPDLESQMGDDMDRIAQKMQAAGEVETGKITGKTKTKAQHTADTEYPSDGGDTYYDQHIEQENNYHVPVATPSETSKAQREAARKLLGGVK